MKVRCKIALAVDPSGAWSAGGGATKDGKWCNGFDYILDGVDPGESRYWVEVDVDVPDVKTIKAKASEVTR